MGASVGLDLGRLALLTVAVFFGQVSIGLSNDAIDAPRDRAVERADKPLALQGAPLKLAWAAAAWSGILALTLSLILGWQITLAHLIFLGSGWAYNTWLKSTIWSALCFVLGFGAFVSLASLSLPDPMLAPAWVTITGASFGIAIHFSNVLPDLEDDKTTGVRGLPHRLGQRNSAIVASTALVAGAATVACATVPAVFTDLFWLPWIGFVLVTGVATAGLVASLRPRASRLGFRLVMLAALLLVGQLLLTGGFTA
jgi:4-hydroxybenzoate polyprenyltransferase